jgi:hypothetical protein
MGDLMFLGICTFVFFLWGVYEVINVLIEVWSGYE